jgi:hypothetical protein
MGIRKSYTVILTDGRLAYGEAHSKADLFTALEAIGISRSEVLRVKAGKREDWEPAPVPTKWRKPKAGFSVDLFYA